jgi:hypothetical protein
MSRAELADAVNTWLAANTNRHGALTEEYIARLEQGRVRWPGREYRAGIRAVLRAATDHHLGFRPSNRRPVSPLAAVPDLSEAVVTPDGRQRLAYVAEKPCRVDRAALDSLAAILAQQRRLEDAIGAAPLVGPVRNYLTVLKAMVLNAQGPLRSAVVDVAAQWAQFTAWLYAATDQFDLSGKWFDRTLEWATEVGNQTMISTVLGFKGHLAWRNDHIGAMIGLSKAAQRDGTVYVGQLAFAAMQEARGHAMAGDCEACDRKMDDASLWAEQFNEHADEAPPWIYYQSPALFTLQRGLINSYLVGRNGVSSDYLTAGLDALPPRDRESQWTGFYRQRLATVQAML